MENVHSLGHRIKTARKHFKLRQEEFGAKIGISANRVSEIENGKGGTNASVLIAMCREFPLDPQWLFSGKGKMLAVSDEKSQPGKDIGSLLASLERQIARIGLKESDEPGSVTKVPLYGYAVPAGIPDPATGEIEEYLDIPASWTQNRKNVYALKVNGDSMTGIGIMKGDILLVEAREKARDGQVVIASVNGEVTVKTLCVSNGGVVSLAPENSRYRPIVITPDMDFRIQGIVLAAVRHY
ncbi:MAG: helix-turn-helix domain-containing protein [Chlorobiaceae bacterium]|nr:helix-turn-helix domain-containing protein [Chlorobiaceae bacterium]NTV61828.1 helix-turn-helix domain-containing protein [Chlorobiaceae bacterium]